MNDGQFVTAQIGRRKFENFARRKVSYELVVRKIDSLFAALDRKFGVVNSDQANV